MCIAVAIVYADDYNARQNVLQKKLTDPDSYEPHQKLLSDPSAEILLGAHHNGGEEVVHCSSKCPIC